MALYRIYRLDPAGHITDAYPVDCRSDNVALNIAPRVWQWAASVEVWEIADGEEMTRQASEADRRRGCW
jgi:hypothetical protein